MKRSEAEAIIGKWLVLGISGFSKTKQEKYTGMNMAQCILADLEEAGMLPPSPFNIPHHDSLYEWEPEDDN